MRVEIMCSGVVSFADEVQVGCMCPLSLLDIGTEQRRPDSSTSIPRCGADVEQFAMARLD
jgi:hypothetical protein